MEKKEPILTPSTDKINDEKTFPQNIKLKNKESKFKKFITKIKSIKLNDKQKKITIACTICLLLVITTMWTVSFLTKDKANVATIETPKIEKNITKTEPKCKWYSFSCKKENKVETVIAPAFDIVRMEKGEAVIAGTSAPNAKVFILDNGKELGNEIADENGSWVFIPKKPLAQGNRKLSLYIIDKDGNKIKSKQSAVLNVSKNSNEEVAVIMGGNTKSKVLKAPRGQEIGALRIEKIDYNDKGNFQIEGRATKNQTINLYLNNKLVIKTTADDKGIWIVNTTVKLKSEEQKLRADMISTKGKVAKRVEYKFTPTFIDGKNSMFIVKKGDCLWNLALKEYGKGIQYVIIFEGNKEQIKDPNKIYIGQVFTMPKKNSEHFEKLKKEYVVTNPKKKK